MSQEAESSSSSLMCDAVENDDVLDCCFVEDDEEQRHSDPTGIEMGDNHDTTEAKKRQAAVERHQRMTKIQLLFLMRQRD